MAAFHLNALLESGHVWPTLGIGRTTCDTSLLGQNRLEERPNSRLPTGARSPRLAKHSTSTAQLALETCNISIGKEQGRMVVTTIPGNGHLDWEARR